MSKEGQSNIKALTYLVETSDAKLPASYTLGGRYQSDDPKTPVSGPFAPREDQANGHINRNIRLLYSLAEGLAPIIEVVNVRTSKAGYTIRWVVSGCVSKVNESSFGLALDDLVQFERGSWSFWR